MNIEKIKQLIRSFAEERGWKTFHTPKNLAMALTVEASELQEIFQWLSLERAQNLTEEELEHTKEEVADVMIFLLMLCDFFQIDLEQAVIDKIQLNKEKYPVEKANRLSKIYQ